MVAMIKTGEELRSKLDFPTERVPLFGARENGDQFSTDRQAIIRTDGEGVRVMGVVSNKYAFLPHVEMLDSFLESLEPMGRVEMTQARVLNYGARFFVSFRFPDRSFPVGSKKDKVNLSLTLRNSYDGVWAGQVLLGAFRLVCSNGLIIGESFFKRKQIHLGGVTVGDIRNEMEEVVEERMERLQSAFRSLHATPVSPEKVKGIWESAAKVIPLRHVNAARAAYENPTRSEDGAPTLWGVYNSFTDHFTHGEVPASAQMEWGGTVFRMLSKLAA